MKRIVSVLLGCSFLFVTALSANAQKRFGQLPSQPQLLEVIVPGSSAGQVETTACRMSIREVEEAHEENTPRRDYCLPANSPDHYPGLCGGPNREDCEDRLRDQAEDHQAIHRQL